VDASKRDFVIGKIVLKEAFESQGGKDEFGVKKGQQYWVLSCELLN
jgi:hypothetical protein